VFAPAFFYIMKISEKGIDLLIRLEGEVLEAYYCEAGVLTIGVGHTGSDIEEGMVITKKQSRALLKKDLRKFEKAVNNEFPKGIRQNEFDAFVIFAFNIGVYGFKSSTALKRAKGKGNKYDVVEAIKRWKYVTVNGQKKVSHGLVKRRNAESCVYLSANYTRWV
jgi:lysozyme